MQKPTICDIIAPNLSSFSNINTNWKGKDFGKLQKNQNSQLHYQISFLPIQNNPKRKKLFTRKLQNGHNLYSEAFTSATS